MTPPLTDLAGGGGAVVVRWAHPGASHMPVETRYCQQKLVSSMIRGAPTV